MQINLQISETPNLDANHRPVCRLPSHVSLRSAVTILLSAVAAAAAACALEPHSKSYDARVPYSWQYKHIGSTLLVC